ncbi:MAG: hypothetical protein JO319_18735 [Acidobacteriaceae bacterium]|nr:hypothetical protein [Acidobacteriaceae bacterium]
MPTFGQFELLEPILLGAEETWLAREHNSERTFLLHKFSRESGIRERLLTMKPQDLTMLVRAGEESGTFFVVTYDAPDLRDFRRWVEERAVGLSRLKPEGPAAVEESPAAPQAGLDALTTTVFRQPAAGVDPQKDIPTVIKPAIQPTSPPSRSPQRPSLPVEPAEPGEFTRMFSTPAVSRAEPQPQPAAPAMDAAEPGEFTRLFQTPLSSPPAAPPVSETATPAPGEFTRMFSVPAVPTTATHAAEPKPAPDPKTEPGEFTRLFQAPATSANPVQPPTTPSAIKAPNEPGDFTKLFSNSLPSSPLASALDNPSSEHPKEPARAPGDFTLQFGRPAAASDTGLPTSLQAGSSAMQPRDTGATGVFAAPPSIAQPVSPAPPASGPGEYTRLFNRPPDIPAAQARIAQSSSAPVPVVPQQEAPVSEAGQARRNLLPLLLILALFALAAIALILFFVLRQQSK